MRDGVERVVANLTDRPGIGPLLLLRDQEHAAHIFKAVQSKRRLGPQAPQLLAQPPIKVSALNALGRKSTILTDIADELGAANLHGESLFHEAEEADAAEAPADAAQSPSEGAAQPGYAHFTRAHIRESAGGVTPDGRPRTTRSRRAHTPLLPGVVLPSSSLHAARAAAAKSAALLDTRVDAYLRGERVLSAACSLPPRVLSPHARSHRCPQLASMRTALKGSSQRKRMFMYSRRGTFLYTQVRFPA